MPAPLIFAWEEKRMGKLLDFDNFLAEKKRQSVEVKVYGKVYKVKKEFPAALVIELARIAETGGKMNAADEGRLTLKMGEALFGKAGFQEICGKGISVEDLAQLVHRTFALVSGKNVDGEDIGETVDDESDMVNPKDKKRKK